MTCALCGEEMEPGSLRGPTNLPTHRECGLRMALGGIGHLVDHALWCGERHDPDAGLTYRESALMVATWVELKGGVEVLLEEEP
jgi:hypothetical protein